MAVEGSKVIRNVNPRTIRQHSHSSRDILAEKPGPLEVIATGDAVAACALTRPYRTWSSLATR